MRRLAALFLFLCLSPSAAWAGAWTVPKNRWYTEYFFRYFGSKKEFDAHGDTSRRAKSASFRDFRNELKLEYGVTDTFNVLAAVPYQASRYKDSNVTLHNQGAGDTYLRAKTRLIKEPFVGSLQMSWKIPGYDTDESPALGDGQFDYELRAQASRAFLFSPYTVTYTRNRETAIQKAVSAARRILKIRSADSSAIEPPRLNYEAVETETRYAKVAFFNAEAGFTARRKAPANEVPLVAEAGFTPLKRLMLIGSLESVLSLKSTHEQEEDFSKWGLRAVVNVWGEGFASIFREGKSTVNLEIGYNDIFAGRNTADAYEIFTKVGVSF